MFMRPKFSKHYSMVDLLPALTLYHGENSLRVIFSWLYWEVSLFLR